MPLQEFSLDDGAINPLALLEQECGVQAITANQQAALQRLLDGSGGGNILVFRYITTTWPPSWAICRQGNDLIVNIAGTVNTQQWAGDVIGCFAADYTAMGVKVHSFFQAAATVVWSEMIPILPSDVGTCRLKISGTSYGGAVAFLIALIWVRTFPGADVQLFEIASPKALTTGYPGPLPRVSFVVRNNSDVVPLVPPNAIVSAVGAINPLFTFAVPINWTHYGMGVQINAVGTLVPVPLSWFDQPITAGGIADTVTSHYLTNYMASTVQQVTSYTNTAYALSVVNLAEELIQAAQTQTIVTNAGALGTIDIPQQNIEVFLSSPTGPLTPANLRNVQSGMVTLGSVSQANAIFTVLSGDLSMPCKVTFFFSVNLAGWSESFIWPNQPPSTFTIANAVSYLKARMNISGDQTVINYVRVAQVGSPRIVQIYAPADLLAGGMATLGGTYATFASIRFAPSDFGGTSLLTRKTAISTQFSRFFIRGIPDFMINNGGTYIPTPRFQVAFAAYVAAIFNLGFQWKSLQQPIPAPPAVVLTGAIQNADGTVTYTLSLPAFNGGQIAAQSKVAARITGQVQPPYLNGPLTVQVLTATTCRTIRPFPLVNFVPNTGRMILPPTATYFSINQLAVEKVVKRGPGKPQGLYRGRSKNRLVG